MINVNATKQRLEAEGRLAPQPEDLAVLTPEQIQHTIHELRTHQVQLEMQNEELQRIQAELSAAHERYFNLYELAPVGYVTLNETGQIAQANLSATTLLGLPRATLVGQELSRLVFKDDQDAYHLLRRQLMAASTPDTGQPAATHSLEARLLTQCGPPVWTELEASAARDIDGTLQYSLTITNISNRKRLEMILAARARLLLFAQTHGLTELLRATLDEAEILTGSKIGFYHFLEADQTTLTLQTWSTHTTTHMCQADGAGQHYPVNKAGVWVDCIRERRAVIHNDYAKLLHRKGMPAGHATVLRELVLPVLRGERIMAILGVGNKTSDYTEDDVQAIAWLADLAWDIAEVKLTEERLLQMQDVQNFLARTSSGTKDHPFFSELARYLAQTLNMDFVCIDRLEGDGLLARTVAVWCDGRFEDNTTYALKDTPCAEVVGQQVCCFPASVCQLFPRDAVLQDLQAESYVGATLYSHAGQPIGLIALISRQPLKARERVESTLQLVAERAAGELERLQAEELLLGSLREKEALLQEIHHRVKNNLQIVSSLLHLQSHQIDSPIAKAAMLDMQSRIHSMALIHEQLYRSRNLADVVLSDYLTQLCQQLFRALAPTSGRIQLHLNLAPMHLEIDKAIPCGLLVNELVTNAFKHAFPAERSGELRVELQPLADGPGWRLRVADNGVGLPPDFALDQINSLGLKLVSDLTRQLRATLAIGAGPGAEFTLVFSR